MTRRDDGPASGSTAPASISSASAASARPRGSKVADRLPGAFAAATVGLQIPYPLTSGEARLALTQLSVLTFAAASATHAVRRRGPRWAVGYLAVAAGGGLLAEAVGVRTGWPFGSYGYADSLGPSLLAVPVVVPLAWAMMAYPVLVFSQYALGARSRLTIAVFGGLLLASWDLFLDPQMIAEGHWTWLTDSPALNGVPLNNAVGWVLVGTCLTGLLTLLPATLLTGARPAATREPPDDAVPLVLLGWTYFSSVFANLVFFGSAAVGLCGGAAMGGLLAAGLWSARRTVRRPTGRPVRRSARQPDHAV